MELLTLEKLRLELASSDVDSIFVDPLLDDSQVGAVTIDFRLGYDFLVSILTRKPSIDIAGNASGHRGVSSYFQETRRELGDRFVLYPGQIALTTSLEYLALPKDVLADVMSRSSFSRLGIQVATMMQPGYRGCIPLELFNHGNSPVELVVGCRICQVRFLKITGDAGYLGQGQRKYFCNVRPTVSRVEKDRELAILSNF